MGALRDRGQSASWAGHDIVPTRAGGTAIVPNETSNWRKHTVCDGVPVATLYAQSTEQIHPRGAKEEKNWFGLIKNHVYSCAIVFISSKPAGRRRVDLTKLAKLGQNSQNLSHSYFGPTVLVGGGMGVGGGTSLVRTGTPPKDLL